MKTFKIIDTNIRNGSSKEIADFRAERYSVSDYGVVYFYVGFAVNNSLVAVFHLAPGQYVLVS